MKKRVSIITAIILLSASLMMVAWDTASLVREKEKTVLTSSGDDEAYKYDKKDRYPYPSKYMEAHKIHMEKWEPEYIDEMNISSTRYFEQIYYEGMLGLNLKIHGNNLTATYFDHSSEDETMTVTIGNEKYILKRNESVTQKLVGEKVEVTGINSRDSRHNVATIVEKIDGYYKLSRPGNGYVKMRVPDDVIDPESEEFTSNKGLTYPTSGKYNRCVHVKLWEDRADEIIYDEGLSDEFKVYLFVDYFSRNCAYDHWGYGERASKVPGKTGDGYEDDNNFLYYSNVGVCFDFTNALVIMCRHEGIPATSLDTYTNGHTVGLVYLDNEWVLIDICDVLLYECNEEDTDKSLWRPRGASFIKTYNYFDGFQMDNFYNTQIWQGN